MKEPRQTQLSSQTNPQHSICITHYNNAGTIRKSLESILNQIDSDFEVVVADNNSNDGSEKILEDYARKGRIRLVAVRVRNRGVGRQAAFEYSRGGTIIANIDLDDVLKPRLKELLDLYHEKCEGYLLWARSTGGFWGSGYATVAPRDLLQRLGGWRDLQFGEDWELVRRAAAAGRYRWTRFQMLAESNPHAERKDSVIGRMKFRYQRYRDYLRCGRTLFDAGEHVSVSQWIPFLLAKLTVPFLQAYDITKGAFDPHREEYFTSFEP